MSSAMLKLCDRSILGTRPRETTSATLSDLMSAAAIRIFVTTHKHRKLKSTEMPKICKSVNSAVSCWNTIDVIAWFLLQFNLLRVAHVNYGLLFLLLQAVVLGNICHAGQPKLGRAGWFVGRRFKPLSDFQQLLWLKIYQLWFSHEKKTDNWIPWYPCGWEGGFSDLIFD